MTIEGTEYTCSEAVERDCTDRIRTAFDKWGSELDRFINSGRLGELGDGENATLQRGQIAQLGLLACSYSESGGTSEDFLEGAKEVKEDLKSDQVRPFWLEAQKTMCPEVTFKD